MSNFIKFLGTAGARVVVSRQLRASGGFWVSVDGTNLSVDPGPGALALACRSRPRLDPLTLDGIFLSHKHLDHAGDVNAMLEGMTEGGRKKRGILFAPKDALEDDPVVFKYVRSYIKEIKVLRAKQKYKLGNVQLEIPVRHDHRVGTYGFKLKYSGGTVSYIPDTRFFPELVKAYKGSKIIIINVLLIKSSHLDHLSVEDAKELIKGIKPKIAVLTHFGRWMLKARPNVVAEELSRQMKTKVIAASDGMRLGI